MNSLAIHSRDALARPRRTKFLAFRRTTASSNKIFLFDFMAAPQALPPENMAETELQGPEIQQPDVQQPPDVQQQQHEPEAAQARPEAQNPQGEAQAQCRIAALEEKLKALEVRQEDEGTTPALAALRRYINRPQSLFDPFEATELLEALVRVDCKLADEKVDEYSAVLDEVTTL